MEKINERNNLYDEFLINITDKVIYFRKGVRSYEMGRG